uniref:Uncharacterized protein n=1 Tax=Aotus nancymaae TaxID=37293 RepID=A0A2K5D6D8_AOTNA
MSPSSEGRPLISGVSVMAQVRSGPPRGAGWGPQTDLSLLAPLTSVHIPCRSSCQQRSYCRGMSQAYSPISVKPFQTLLCLCLCVCV